MIEDIIIDILEDSFGMVNYDKLVEHMGKQWDVTEEEVQGALITLEDRGLIHGKQGGEAIFVYSGPEPGHDTED